MRLRVILVLIILIVGSMLFQASALASEIYTTYNDSLADVFDSNQGVNTNEKPEYDILNSSVTFSDNEVTLEMNLASSIDLEGYYIFQATVDGTPEFLFYFNKLNYYGKNPNQAVIPVTGTNLDTKLTITILKIDLPAWNTFELNNVSAQSADLTYGDVMECEVELPETDTINEMTVYVQSSQSILVEYRSTYTDSIFFKSYLDTNRNGYVEAMEIDEFAFNLETSLKDYIKENKNEYYGASISLNDKSPWDIYAFVEVTIPEAQVSIPDGTNVLFKLQLHYKDIPSGSFEMNIPIDSGLLEAQVQDYTLTVHLADGYEIDKKNSDNVILPYIFQNKTGLQLKDSDLQNLPVDRYNIQIKTDSPERDEKALYILIAFFSIIFAVAIFFGYIKIRDRSQQQKLEQERVERKESKKAGKKERSKNKEKRRRGK